MTMSSYNKFNNNILRDTLIVSIGNCFSSVFAGFGVFSFLGHMAYKNCMPVQDVVKSGPGLAFIAYPEAMSLLPASQLRFKFIYVLYDVFPMNDFSQSWTIHVLLFGENKLIQLPVNMERIIATAQFIFLQFSERLRVLKRLVRGS